MDLGSAELRLHWTLALIALPVVAGICVSQAAAVGTLGFVLGWIAVVFTHEFGHAALAWHCGQRVVSLELHAFGGRCRYEQTTATPAQQALIAWGGVLAQLALLVTSYAAARLFQVRGEFANGFLLVTFLLNGVLALVNLTPAPPLDGAAAWRLPMLLFAEFRRRRSSPAARRAPRRPGHLRVVHRHDEHR